MSANLLSSLFIGVQGCCPLPLLHVTRHSSLPALGAVLSDDLDVHGHVNMALASCSRYGYPYAPSGPVACPLLLNIKLPEPPLYSPLTVCCFLKKNNKN